MRVFIMAANVARTTHETLLNTVRPQMAKCQTEPNQPEFVEGFEFGTDLLSLVDTARRRAGLKLEYLTRLNGLKSKGHLSSALSGREHFQLVWLDAWPQEFWNEFVPLVRDARDGGDQAKKANRKRLLTEAIALLIDEVA
jgi:hypothetical protein